MITTVAGTAVTTTGGHTGEDDGGATGGTDRPGYGGPRRAADVHVWTWRTPGTPDPADLLLLDEDERARVHRCRHPRDAAALARTRAGARRALGGLLGTSPAEVSLGNAPCSGCGSRRHGPPLLLRPALSDPPGLSLARTEGCGVLAVCAGTSVGIDVEAVRSVDAEGLAEVVLTERERAHVLGVPEGPVRALRHFRCWTRKEAVVKAAGTGLMAAELTRLEVYPEESAPVRVELRVRGRRSTWWQVRDVPLDGPWTAAVAHPETSLPPGRLVVHPES
ncbi:4'-phosphopantetheinyl transferase family protein [Streptomyces sp. NPDC057438]|uniref:4'-phosphopantetheinyl transferase family protein n=1 Tax=Streptomyces sp. NPDC057438 TaxID=3346133 RepID=UPI0036CC5A44